MRSEGEPHVVVEHERRTRVLVKRQQAVDGAIGTARYTWANVAARGVCCRRRGDGAGSVRPSTLLRVADDVPTGDTVELVIARDDHVVGGRGTTNRPGRQPERKGG